jgi:5-(carboxyamino)imidazole ribonucleotide mutase
MPLVSLVMGSKSDSEMLQPAIDILKEFGIDCDVQVISAHRTPEKARQYAQGARDKGIEVIIAAAGGAAHLPGVLAGWTTLPVIGIPLPSSDLKGLDALYSIVQMPAGVPVACVSVGAWGVKNAAYFATQILALKYEAVRQAWNKYKNDLARS